MSVQNNNNYAKPFIRWAGGKTQLIKTIELALHKSVSENNKLTYVEPFIGGGALLFWALQKFPDIKQAIINDLNPDLISTYIAVKYRPQNFVDELLKLEKEYNSLNSVNDKLYYYLEKRHEFNHWRNSNE